MNRVGLAAGAGVLVALVVAATLWWRLSTPNASSAPPSTNSDTGHSRPAAEPEKPALKPWRCLPPVGAQLAWNVRNHSTYVIDPTALLGPGSPGRAQRGTREFSARLRASATAPAGAAVPDTAARHVVMALQDVVVRDNGSVSDDPTWQELNRPVVVEFGGNCGIERVGFGPGVGPGARNEWRLLLGLLDVKAGAPSRRLRGHPAGRAAASWQVRHRDPTGIHVARYDRTSAAGKPVTIRRRLRYVTVHAAAAGVGANARKMKARVLASMVQIRLRDLGGIASWQGREELRLQTEQGGLFAQTATALDITPTEPVSDAPGADADLTWSEPGALEPAGSDPHFDVPEGPQPTDFAAAIRRLEELAKGGQQRLALGVMVPWLRAHPEDAAALIAAIKAGDVAGDARPVAFLALELAGTPESRAALVAALNDPDMDEADRSRAAAALQDVPEPGDEVVSGVLKAATEGPINADETAAAALLAVGSLAGRQDVAPEHTERLGEHLTGTSAGKRASTA